MGEHEGITLPALEAVAVTKAYGEARVLSDVSLSVAPGEVHALLGENGAGKSTLIKIISGVVRPDGGTFTVAGAAGPFADPRDAERHGVATLHQELSVVPGLSVAENVMLGRSVPHRLGFVRWRQLRRDVEDIFDRLGYRIDVRRDASQLSPIQQTMTSLARALSLEARLLILDEPTAALTDFERRKLFDVIRRTLTLGVGVLYVSHRLEEVFEIGDTYTVLRNGEVVERGWIADTSPEGVVTAMAGRRIDAVYPPRQPSRSATVLDVDAATGHKVRDVRFAVAEGEIVGVAGLAGSGRSELLRLVAGAQHGRAATIRLDGRAVRCRRPTDAHRHGMVYVPEERRAAGLVPDTVVRNLNLTTIGRHVTLAPFVSPAKERRHAGQLWRQFAVRGSSDRQQVLNLSGGNQQKVVLAKYLALRPRVVLLDEPTRGVDVGTKAEIYRMVAGLAADGAAVVMVSSDLPELIGVCHRIIVLNEGRLVDEFRHEDFEEHALLSACYGKAARR